MINSIELEILAPAKNAEIGRIAVNCGADAVYIGPPSFGARAAAGNSISDIEQLADYAHLFGAKVYATMNTILFDNEIEVARKMALELYDAGVDALIVQDMAYIEMGLPIALHASTQCDIRSPQKAAWLAAAGFRQLVLPREFTIDQIRTVAEAADIPVEVFIHGARCVSYSGDCQMGYAATGRSANRGECPQMCRLPYELIDSSGKIIRAAQHYLSLSDMSTPSFEELIAAGARSFKIEGRLKDYRYVANSTAWYSQLLDKLIEKSKGKYRRSSFGRCELGFIPDINKGYFRRPNGGGLEACLASPNDTGTIVGIVSNSYSTRSRSFKFKGKALANGDGLGFFDKEGKFNGFRLNRIQGNECFPAKALPELRAGTTLLRNADKEFNDTMETAYPERRLKVDFVLSYNDSKLTLMAKDELNNVAEYCITIAAEPSRSPQQEQHNRLLGKLGNTPYYLGTIDDRIEQIFVPASVLAEARRNVLTLLKETAINAYTRQQPKHNVLSQNSLNGIVLNYHDNVSNHLSQQFYTFHGAIINERALEYQDPTKAIGKTVMTTRYCLRRELGACLKEATATQLPFPLFLRNESGKYRIDFDCKHCSMKVVKLT